MQSLILCRKDKWREESDARGNVPGKCVGGVRIVAARRIEMD